MKNSKRIKKNTLCRELDLKFYHRDEITVCVASFEISLLKSMKDNDELYSLIERRFPKTYLFLGRQYIKVTTTSRPAEGDVYDRKKGETVAHSKAQRKAFRLAAKVLRLISNWLAKKSAETEMQASFMMRCFEREDKYIRSL